MFRLLLTAALLATAYAACEDFAINYVMPPPGGQATMDVSICAQENIIRSSMATTDDFAGVSILEDYDVGFGATRVESEEGCYIHKLQFNTLAQQAKVLKSKKRVPLDVNQSVDLITVAVEEPSEYGSRLEEFCGELPIYKVGINEEDPAEVRALTWETSEDEQSSRCIGLNFNNCVLILFIPVCTLTTLTFPTGITVTFTWFFFG